MNPDTAHTINRIHRMTEADGTEDRGWNNRPKVVETIPDDRPVWFISDLHIGDATPCDVFFGKDHHLMALIRRVKDEGATLVIAGDAIDFHQAWSCTRVLRAHQELFSALSELAREGRVYYVIGNHDYEINLFKEILQFRVCDELHIGDRILCVHGWQYDLDGSSALIVDQDDWGRELDPKAAGLRSVRVDTWGGWVFVNPDGEGESLLDYLGEAADCLGPFELDRMRYRWRKWLILPCNWKTSTSWVKSAWPRASLARCSRCCHRPPARWPPRSFRRWRRSRPAVPGCMGR